MPLAIDLFCGLGGWTEALLAEGWKVIGFDNERHVYGDQRYPAQLVLQDVLTLHGSQFRNVDLIVASPPCTEYSYMSMPWSRGKQIARALRGDGEFPEAYTGSRTISELNALFDACFRIQREASEAAGRKIPMVVENVKGAQPWVGKAKANYGSFYLWGDVDSIGGRIVRAGEVRFGAQAVKAAARGMKRNPDGTAHPQGSWFAIADSKQRGAKGRLHGWSNGTWESDATKNNGGSWFGVAHNTESGTGQNPVNGVKQVQGGSWFGDYQAQKTALMDGLKCGGDRFNDEQPSLSRLYSSKSPARKAASAQIAKIPYPLALHIACVFKAQP